MSKKIGILEFCGSQVEVEFDPEGPDSREGFRMYDDGQFKEKSIRSRQPNVLRTVIIGKKSWGLWLDQWTDGITEWLFTKEEILMQFEDKGIKIPESFLKDFDNTLERKRLKRNMKYLEELNK